jgi:hypothetical protein
MISLLTIVLCIFHGFLVFFCALLQAAYFYLNEAFYVELELAIPPVRASSSKFSLG